jgi:hypothetical protein
VEENMDKNLNDLFEEINKIEQSNQNNQSGIYVRRERKVEIVAGIERIIEIIRFQKPDSDGILNIIEEIRYLCQGCNSVWVVPGVDKFTNDKKILCGKCSFRGKIKNLSKPVWGFFIKSDEKK